MAGRQAPDYAAKRKAVLEQATRGFVRYACSEVSRERLAIDLGKSPAYLISY